MDPALGGKKEKSSATVEKRQKSLIITPQIAANCHSPAEEMEGETLAWNTQTRKKEAKGGTLAPREEGKKGEKAAEAIKNSVLGVNDMFDGPL